MARRTKRFTNVCMGCGYSWAPRGHALSHKCPRCGSGRVSTSGLNLFVLGLLVGAAALVFLAIEAAFKTVAAALRGPWGPLYIVLAVVAVAGIAATLVAKRNAARRWAERLEEDRMQAARSASEQQDAAAQARYSALHARFGEEVARRILARELWVGATREMLVEAFGQPEQVAEKVLKTKVKHTLTYRPAGGPGLRVKLDDGVVVGWDR